MINSQAHFLNANAATLHLIAQIILKTIVVVWTFLSQSVLASKDVGE
jgi:hypothetical protein